MIFIPPVAATQHTTTLLPGVISTVDTGLTSTCVDTGITSTITSSHQPTPQPKKDPIHVQTISTLTIDAQGNIISQPKPSSKITSIEKWTDAYLIYFSIHTAVQPLKSQQLFKYMHDVRLEAQNSNRGFRTLNSLG